MITTVLCYSATLGIAVTVYDTPCRVDMGNVGYNEYLVGPRSALAWLLDRYRVTTDKDSGIVNDPNDWGSEVGDPRYIVDLVKRVTTVSVETMAIVKALPPLEEGA